MSDAGKPRSAGWHTAEDAALDQVSVAGYQEITEQSPSSKGCDEYRLNEQFWADAQNNRLWDGCAVRLSEFDLSEWAPQSPGRSHTRTAERFRREAELYLRFDEDLGPHLKPEGKSSMVQAGVGSIRLCAFESATLGTSYVVGATSSKSCEQGVPVIVPLSIYENLIEDIKRYGHVQATVSGRCRIVPDVHLLEVTSRVPRYCVVAEDVRPKRSWSGRRPRSEHVWATARIVFSVDSEQPAAWEAVGKKWATSYTTFPLVGTTYMDDAVSWLERYVAQYGEGEQTSIIGDFDETVRHFSGVRFPLQEMTNLGLVARELKSLAEAQGRQIYIEGDLNIEQIGDRFERISGSTVVNRSRIIREE